MAKILNNRNELKELMKKRFSRPHPLSPSPQMWRGGTEGGEVKDLILRFVANETHIPLCIREHIHMNISN